MRKCRAGFTLVELLISIAIIAMLIAMLLPAIHTAIDRARLLQCQGNERQICLGLFNYAADWRGKFPPNATTLNNWWYDADRIGRYLKASGVPTGQPGGPVYTCPNDDANAHLSYSMNVWASSQVDPGLTAVTPPTATLWTTVRGNSARLLLVGEAYSYSGNYVQGWYAVQAIGSLGLTAGARFGGGAGLTPPTAKGRFGYVTSELCFMRHRRSGSGGVYTQPIGMINIGYADGHVETKANTDLLTGAGNSSGDTLWSATDVVGP